MSMKISSGFVEWAMAGLLCSIFLFAACPGAKKQEPPKKPPVPVSVAGVMQKDVPVQLTAIGNVEAYATVAVKAQVSGELSVVHFKEGDRVKKGDLLFTIDPRPFEAAIREGEANLAKDTAQLEHAREQARRYAELNEKGFLSREEYDQVRTNAQALEAAVQADKAALDNDRLQLTYCFIRSPINGRTGSLMADRGNLIKAQADTPMLIINQIQPVYVRISVPEQQLPEIRRHMAGGILKVEAFPSEDKNPVQGVLTFVDNTVDVTTGTIRLKATFENRDERLWPGQFINVALTLTTEPHALVVSSSAIQTGQDGQYVYVVRKDNTVESRTVVVTRTVGDETVIERGLDPGETVVTDGQLRLIPGARVEIKERP